MAFRCISAGIEAFIASGASQSFCFPQHPASIHLVSSLDRRGPHDTNPVCVSALSTEKRIRAKASLVHSCISSTEVSAGVIDTDRANQAAQSTVPMGSKGP
jgi:hypothetical protein